MPIKLCVKFGTMGCLIFYSLLTQMRRVSQLRGTAKGQATVTAISQFPSYGTTELNVLITGILIARSFPPFQGLVTSQLV